MKKCRYIIFDMDGTLIDSMPYWHNLGRNYLLSKGLKPDDDLNQIIKNMTMTESAEYFQKRYHLSEDIRTIINEVNSLIEYYYKSEIPLKKGVDTFLKQLKKNNIKMCIATTSSKYLAEMVCKRLNIEKYFDFIVSADEIGSGKDTPEIYYKCSQLLKADREQTVIFEDALYAVCTAVQAGYQCIAVYDESQGKLSNDIFSKCMFYIDSFEDLKIADKELTISMAQ